MNEIAIIIGALIGGGISIITNWLQQRNTSKREFTKMAYEMAVKEYSTLIETGKPGNKVAPLESFVTYYLKYFEVVHRKNFRIEDLEKFREFRQNLNDFYSKESKK